MCHVGHVVGAFRNILRDHPTNLLCFEHSSRCQVVERKLGFRATCTRHTGPRLRRLTIPKNAIARRMSHRTTTSEFIEQATRPRTLSELHRRLLVLEELDTSATGLRKRLEERLWSLQIVQRNITGSAAGNGHEYLRDPVWVTRTARYVDHRQAPLALEVRT